MLGANKIDTGYAEEIVHMAGRPDPTNLEAIQIALDGGDERLLEWIAGSKIAAIATDNYAVEMLPTLPAPAPAPLAPLHDQCLFRFGLPLGELWHFQALAESLLQHGRNRFFLSATPLNMPGAAGSPLTPLAIV